MEAGANLLSPMMLGVGSARKVGKMVDGQPLQQAVLTTLAAAVEAEMVDTITTIATEVGHMIPMEMLMKEMRKKRN